MVTSSWLFVDMASAEIINNRAINLTNNNIVTDLQSMIDGRNTIVVY